MRQGHMQKAIQRELLLLGPRLMGDKSQVAPMCIMQVDT